MTFDLGQFVIAEHVTDDDIVPEPLRERIDGWLILNAARPLIGTLLPEGGRAHWQGEFLFGVYYAAVDPSADDADWALGQNLRLDAKLIQPVTVAAHRARLINYVERVRRPAMGEIVEAYYNDDYDADFSYRLHADRELGMCVTGPMVMLPAKESAP